MAPLASPNAPIGVFDSGIGGLTVARELIRTLPYENILYLGDTARVPYGVRSPETVQRYAAEGAAFLLSRGIKMLVIACNTVSAVGMQSVRQLASDLPSVEVIGPGSRAAARATRSGRVGVIGTAATIQSGVYVRALKALRPEIEVQAAACPLFVPLVEEGWLTGEVPRLVAAEYLSSLKAKGVDTVVLGCTHYPLLKGVLAEVLGPGVTLIDSARETAAEVAGLLERSGLLRTEPEGRRLEFFVTDSPAKFLEVGGRFLGQDIDRIEKVVLEEYRT